VCQPGIAQDLEAAPAVVRRQGDAEEVSHLAIEVGQSALRAGEHAGDDIGQGGEVVGESAQCDGLAGAGVAGDESKPALANEAFKAPAEVLDLG
jgi:hypothetical protein